VQQNLLCKQAKELLKFVTSPLTSLQALMVNPLVEQLPVQILGPMHAGQVKLETWKAEAEKCILGEFVVLPDKTQVQKDVKDLQKARIILEQLVSTRS
jgi:hypothetical protein